jgi:hypothetical protein
MRRRIRGLRDKGVIEIMGIRRRVRLMTVIWVMIKDK